MPLYILVKVDFGHREYIGLFDTQDKAKAYQTALEMEMFDSSNLCGITFYIEECFVK
jgi:hypothetical protein